MSLNYDFTQMHDAKGLHEDDKEWLITECMIYGTTWVGIHKITEENWEEFYRRLNLMFQCGETNGMLSHDPETLGDRIALTPADVHRRIGLSTNASAKTKTAFHKGLIEGMEYNVRRDIEQFNKAKRNIETLKENSHVG